MKIATWNVNGLRAALQKGAGDWLRAAGDILCLQEIRARREQLSAAARGSLEGYTELWHPARRAGYSGVATFTRPAPLDVEIGLGEDRFDREGRVIGARFSDFILYNLYAPNGRRDHSRVAFELEFYAAVLQAVERAHRAGEGVILCGDFNTAHRPIDLRNPQRNRRTTGFLTEERAWIDRFLEAGLVDVYRERYPDRPGYTWWTYRFEARRRDVGWRLDYFLVSERLVARVADVQVRPEVLGSDHCPVTLRLTYQSTAHSQ